jgi:hypothetical protein
VSAPEAIQAFWDWWPFARSHIEIAIAAGDLGGLPTQVTPRVQAIHAGLQWELAPGTRAANQLCLSGAGDLRLRPFSEAWVLAAPPADATWEFHAARQPSAKDKLTIGGFELHAEEARIDIAPDEARERLDVVLHHPEFARMPKGLPGQAGFLFLDAALGEDGVERWLGTVDFVGSVPPESMPLAELRRAVEWLAKRSTGARWAIFRGSAPDGRPYTATVNQALKRIDHLFYDYHLEARLPIPGGGLPNDEQSDRLNQIEDSLGEALGPEARGFARVTLPGVRVLHYYARDGAAAWDRMEAWAAGQDPAPGLFWHEDTEWRYYREGLYRPPDA